MGWPEERSQSIIFWLDLPEASFRGVADSLGPPSFAEPGQKLWRCTLPIIRLSSDQSLTNSTGRGLAHNRIPITKDDTQERTVIGRRRYWGCRHSLL
jgi:hypothetical protein